MISFMFWWVVSLLAMCLGGGVVAFWVYGLYPRALITSAVCAAVIWLICRK